MATKKNKSVKKGKQEEEVVKEEVKEQVEKEETKEALNEDVTEEIPADEKQEEASDTAHNESDIEEENDNNEAAEEADMEEKDELTLALEKAAELSDKNLRLQAEFDNYRKRTLKEKIEMTKTAGEKLIKDILPVMDDFDRAIGTLDSAQDIEAVKEGVHLIYSKFESFLKQNGVEPIPTDDGEFDTELHEAITQIPAPNEEQKGKIIDCVQKGYKLNDKVIRHSKVVVGA